MTTRYERLVEWWHGTGQGYLPRLLGAALTEWVGTGLFVAASAIYLVRIAGISERAVGLGMTLAGLGAMLTVVPIGMLADRYGIQRSLIAVCLWRAAATAGYAFVDGWLSFVLVTTAVVVGEQAAHPLTQALIGERTADSRRTRVMAAHRTVLNIGISVGGLLAVVPLTLGTPAAFRWSFVGTALLFVVAAGLVALLPGTPRSRYAAPAGRLAALRDRRLLALTAYDSVATLWLPILNVALPLWVVGHTDVPPALVGILYAVNTVTVTVLQIPMSRFVDGTRAAQRSYSVSAALLALTCGTFALAPGLPSAATPVALVVAILVLSLGELCQVNAAWTLSYAVAPTARRAEYLAAFGLGRNSSSRLYGPLLMTGVVLAWGTAGWLMLGVLFVVAALVPFLLIRTIRPQEPAGTHAAETPAGHVDANA
ncbi:MFS transporter [Micromonospora sp. HUAS LYJ1]|uniref:MFS transporter n=1 Tax=Micromonospora sp. HUAS LYJ1 TaxID=3061626 RepID=UPI0026724B65|nr:MFS transporter [Micromonospora sp. HUAS LYJ1]WKU02937.1 MFS transporter [Micromonospora sp. HUAS LYJ1]